MTVYDSRWPRPRVRSLSLTDSTDLQELLEQLRGVDIEENRRYAVEGAVLLRLISWLERYAEFYRLGVESDPERGLQIDRRPQGQVKE